MREGAPRLKRDTAERRARIEENMCPLRSTKKKAIKRVIDPKTRPLKSKKKATRTNKPSVNKLGTKRAITKTGTRP